MDGEPDYFRVVHSDCHFCRTSLRPLPRTDGVVNEVGRVPRADGAVAASCTMSLAVVHYHREDVVGTAMMTAGTKDDEDIVMMMDVVDTLVAAMDDDILDTLDIHTQHHRHWLHVQVVVDTLDTARKI